MTIVTTEGGISFWPTCPASSFCPDDCFSFTSSTAFSFFLIALARFSLSSTDRREKSTGSEAAAAAAEAIDAAAYRWRNGKKVNGKEKLNQYTRQK